MIAPTFTLLVLLCTQPGTPNERCDAHIAEGLTIQQCVRTMGDIRKNLGHQAVPVAECRPEKPK